MQSRRRGHRRDPGGNRDCTTHRSWSTAGRRVGRPAGNRGGRHGDRAGTLLSRRWWWLPSAWRWPWQRSAGGAAGAPRPP